MKRFLIILFCFWMLVTLVGCSDETGADNETDAAAENGGDKEVTYSIGEKVVTQIDSRKEGNVEITLDAVEESTYKGDLEEGQVNVCMTFTVKNDSEEEYTISSMMLFDVFFDGSEEESSFSFMTILAGDYTQLDGKIQPGETVTGTIAYTTSESWQSIEIRFWASYSAAERIVFSYQK